MWTTGGATGHASMRVLMCTMCTMPIDGVVVDILFISVYPKPTTCGIVGPAGPRWPGRRASSWILFTPRWPLLFIIVVAQIYFKQINFNPRARGGANKCRTIVVVVTSINHQGVRYTLIYLIIESKPEC